MTTYQMIRVSKRTHERLKAFSAKLFDDYAAGIVELPDHQAEHVSFDYVINRLLNAVNDHRWRAKLQRQNTPPQSDGDVKDAEHVYTLVESAI